MSGSLFPVRAPLLWIVVPYCIGIGASKQLEVSSWIWLAAIGLGLVIASVFLSQKSGVAWGISIGIGVSCIAFAYTESLDRQFASHYDRPPREAFLELEITRIFRQDESNISGIGIDHTLSDPPRFSKGSRLFFRLDRRGIEGPLARGERIACRGVLKRVGTDPQTNGFQRYLINTGTRFMYNRGQALQKTADASAFRQAVNLAESQLHEILSRGLNSANNTNSTYLAMMLGLKRELSEDQKEVFLKNGAMHLFAISGLHIGIIALCIHKLLKYLRMPNRWLPLPCLAAVLIFVLATGGSASSWRAFLMVASMYLCQATRRESFPVQALALSALICLVIDPRQLFQASFQMSYATVGAILLYGLPLTNRVNQRIRLFRNLPLQLWTRWHRLTRKAVQGLVGLSCLGLATFATTSVYSILYFNTLPSIGTLTNIVLLPLASLAIVAGFCSIVSGLAQLSIFSILFNNIAILILFIAESALTFIASFSWSALHFDAPNIDWLFALSIISLAGFALGYSQNWQIRLRWMIALPFACCILAIAIASY